LLKPDMKNTLMVILGCDCDPDRPRYGGAYYDKRSSPQRWRGISEGIDLLRERLQRIESLTDIKPKVVFCLRSDPQVEETCGETAWLIKKYADTWHELEDEGHELAWHPHLWRWSDESKCWFQEIEDSEWIGRCLEHGFEEFSRALGYNPATSHMGWTFHNNVTMRKIAELGLRVDFSACPGVYHEGGPGDGGTVFDNMIDWREAPQTWYRPSKADYRRPARGDEDELDIIEIPKFTSKSSILKKAKSLGSRAGGLFGSQKETSVFLQVTALPILYDIIIKERFRYQEGDPFFASYFHPDELLSASARSAKSFLYSINNLEKNLLKIIETARSKGMDVKFITGNDVIHHLGLRGKD
jgi:hypothetical protein